jgi:hypothetical protein
MVNAWNYVLRYAFHHQVLTAPAGASPKTLEMLRARARMDDPFS